MTKKQHLDAAMASGETVVQFYSKSKDVADLGRLGEGPTDSSWDKLANFHPIEITVKNHTYPSVEHYFHAGKALCSNRPLCAQELEVAGGRIGQLSPLEAKKAGGKAGFARVGATLNVTTWLQTRDKAVARALKARAKVDPLFCRILLATRKRRLSLLHFERGGNKKLSGRICFKRNGKPSRSQPKETSRRTRRR
jgi:predicted NAD-dependent protein-ADP-ribosyltransferase YbiA (DUF1768 family)